MSKQMLLKDTAQSCPLNQQSQSYREEVQQENHSNRCLGFAVVDIVLIQAFSPIRTSNSLLLLISFFNQTK